MWPFDISRNDSPWESVLSDCDFELARAEFSDFFQMVNREAETNGEQVVFRQEFVDGWKIFSANPSSESARKWLALMPGDEDVVLKVFVDCCPGGAAKVRAQLFETARSNKKIPAPAQNGPAFTFGGGDGLTLGAAVALIPLHLEGLRPRFEAALGEKLTPEMLASNAVDGAIAEMCKMVWIENKYGKEDKDNWLCGRREYLPGAKQSQELTFRDGSTITLFFDFSAFHPSGWV